MAIANVLNSMKSLASMLPEFAAPNLNRIEDQFISTDDNGLTLLSGTEGNAPCEIIITCKNKRRRITGLLSQGVKLTGQAEWKEMFGGGITALGGSVISAVNSGMQAINGTSIQQPWMNRKFWNSTKPFSFTFSFNLVSDGNSGKGDVFLPAQALMSFVYPRDLGTSEAIKDVLNRSGIVDTNQRNTTGRSNVLNATVDTFGKAFAIPGPAIGYSEANIDKTKEYDGMGDFCTIVVGNLFAFGGVYIEKVDVEFSPCMDSSGYPTYAKCNVQATAMDVNTCKTNGDFLISQFKDNQAALSALLDSVKTTVSDSAKNVVNIAKSTASAIGFIRNKE